MARSSSTFTSKTAGEAGKLRVGTKAKKVILRTNAQLIAAAKKITPLEVLTGLAGDETLPTYERERAAEAAAPYIHRKQPQDVNMSGTLQVKTSFAEAVKAKRK